MGVDTCEDLNVLQYCALVWNSYPVFSAPLAFLKSGELILTFVFQLKGVSSTLEAEKASRADLELYTAILNTQKTALTDDVDRLRTQLTELRRVGFVFS